MPFIPERISDTGRNFTSCPRVKKEKPIRSAKREKKKKASGFCIHEKNVPRNLIGFISG
jgi:hypothetical protein